MNRILGRWLAGCALALAAANAAADSYPSKPVKIVVPMVAGGAVDTLARLLGTQLSDALGKTVVIENKPGATGAIGADYVAKSAPDGYTLLIPDMGTLTVGPAVQETPFDSVRDFAPVTMLITSPYGVAVFPGLPINSMADLVAYAKANPGKLNFAHLGNGSASHLAGIEFANRAGIQWTYVPYKGGAQALPDVAAGNSHVLAIGMLSTITFVRTNRLRLLAVSSKDRLSFLPDAPTVAESGYPGYVAALNSALFAPKGTPKEVIERLRAETHKIMSTPDMKKRLAEQATEVTLSTPEELARFVADERAKWTRVVKASGVKIE
jgi:tripartite-type tricarboxylate transporter receptor subunit TctC